jgi:hypothetical protein
MPVRKILIDQALVSYAGLTGVLDELTEEEVIACLELEAGSRRRQTILDRLTSRAVRLNELSYNRQLKEKFHGTRPKQDHDRR